MTDDALDREEIARYARHLVLPEVGVEGQRRLKASSIAIVGAGGLGAPVGLYLAAAGVGRIGLVDFDRVDASNLQRQVLYGTSDVGLPKVDAARRRLADLNPRVRLEVHDTRVTAGNALDLLGTYDVIVDGTDNFPTRYLVNDAAVLLGKPNVYGSIFRFEGQVAVFAAPGGPCYRCLYPEPPAPGEVPNCAEGGVLGILPGVIGSLQATEAIKLLLGVGAALVGRLLLYDGLEGRFRELRVPRDPDCPVCGDRPSIVALRDEDAACEAEAGRAPLDGPEISVRGLRERLERGDDLTLIDVRTPMEWAICRIDGARLLPLQELPARVEELDRERETVVYCHVGQRSAVAAEWLRRRGFSHVRNLAGGIDAWASEIEPGMPRY